MFSFRTAVIRRVASRSHYNSTNTGSSLRFSSASNRFIAESVLRRDLVSDELFTQFRPVSASMLNNAMIGGNTLMMPEQDDGSQPSNQIIAFEQQWLVDRLADLSLSKTGSIYEAGNENPVDFVPAVDIHLISGDNNTDSAVQQGQNVGVLQLSSTGVEYHADSVRRKRRKKMRRHKYRKRLKETRAQRRRTKQRKENAALKAES